MDNNLISNILQLERTNLIRGGTGNSYASFGLKLQLHGQVSNPYMFNIKGNYKASAVIPLAYAKKEYRTPGTYSLTLPSGITKIKAQVAGAGGGGASGDRYLDGVYGGTGGRGEGKTQIINNVSGLTCSITVGKGGSAGSQGASGHPIATDASSGGNSSIKVGSTTITARGGGGGKAAHGSAGAMVLLILEEQQEDKAELIQHNIIEAQQPVQMVGLL